MILEFDSGAKGIVPAVPIIEAADTDHLIDVIELPESSRYLIDGDVVELHPLVFAMALNSGASGVLMRLEYMPGWLLVEKEEVTASGVTFQPTVK